MSVAVEVRRVETADDLAGALAVRRRVFVEGQGVPASLEHDAHDRLDDPDVLHVVALADGAPVGAGRVLLTSGGVARVGRMAVLPALRSAGLGARLLALLEDAAAERGAVEVLLHAQVPARRFYERAGYVAEGEEYEEAGLAHVTMRRALLPGLRDARDEDAPAVQQLIGGCFAEYDGCVLDLADLDAWMVAPGSTTSRHLWVLDAPDGGPLRATVGWHPVDDATAELKSLYVRRSERGRGLGRRLVRLVERAARDAGRSRMVLWSDTRFLDAHRLYRSLGYAPLPGTRELHDPSGTVELSFARDLP